MHHGRFALLVLVLSVAVLSAAPAEASTQNRWDVEQQDGYCQDITGNWVQCGSMGGMAGGGGGVAPLITSCTSAFGCEKCTLSNKDYSSQCGIAVAESGSCICEVDARYTSTGGCKLTGKCTFR